MGRTLLRQREIEQKELYIGKILIFCEGYTEKNYFEFFKKLIKDKFSNIVIETETIGSNARAVYNYAESFLKNDQNVSKYAVYDKYLVFDCDAPDDILDVIDDAKSSANQYQLLISSLLFECWLLMHIEILPAAPLRKKAIGDKLTKHLDLDDYENHKDDEGIIAKIIKGQDNLSNAIKNARDLRELYQTQGKTIETIIDKYLPYSEVYELVEQLAIAASI